MTALEHLSPAEILAELGDMREHVPHLAALYEVARTTTSEQARKTREVYGRDRRTWPASSLHAVESAERSSGAAWAALGDAREYLAELEQAAAR